MKHFIVLIFLFAAISCAKTDEQIVDSSKREALYYLTHDDCSKAKDALDEAGYQDDDGEYIRLYSDVYACKAGYSQLTTVIDNLTSLSATSTDFFRTLAAFPSSQVESAADSTAYTNIMLAIRELLKGGASTETSATVRIAKFGDREAGDMHFQALFLILIEMGKFLAYHGNVDSTGTEGAGGSWSCLIEYTDATAVGYVTGGGDSCDAGTVGSTSPETLTVASSYVTKLCELTVLFNNLRDILSNITFSSNSSELGSVVDIAAMLNSVISAASAEPAVGTYSAFLSQSACEAQASAEANHAEVGQRFFSLILENLQQ